MRKRIAKKRAALFTALVLSVPLTLDHARPSFWRLGRGGQRYHLYRRMVEGLAIPPRIADRAARLWSRRPPSGADDATPQRQQEGS